MIYKPEHITDLDTGVIVAAEVSCVGRGAKMAEMVGRNHHIIAPQ